ncbi:hypothetical protein ACFQ07_12345 [Actinomadura adrarensis]|uniref:Uncharacterized protein n=1 Tax=Actinomadura adrarensis TaxID=1819600 RepID=A0ABW3CGG7_9ACTN
MPDLLAGTKILALDTPPTVSATAGISFTTNGVAFTVGSITGGTYADCAVVFTAPTTGRVKIHVSARLINAGTSGTLIATETREGDVIGSGDAVEIASDALGVSHYGASFARLGACHLLSGLTPGASYNTRILHRVSASSGDIALRELIVEPAT